jgi:hypothetical protein
MHAVRICSLAPRWERGGISWRLLFCVLACAVRRTSTDIVVAEYVSVSCHPPSSCTAVCQFMHAWRERLGLLAHREIVPKALCTCLCSGLTLATLVYVLCCAVCIEWSEILGSICWSRNAPSWAQETGPNVQCSTAPVRKPTMFHNVVYCKSRTQSRNFLLPNTLLTPMCTYTAFPSPNKARSEYPVSTCLCNSRLALLLLFARACHWSTQAHGCMQRMCLCWSICARKCVPAFSVLTRSCAL